MQAKREALEAQAKNKQHHCCSHKKEEIKTIEPLITFNSNPLRLPRKKKLNEDQKTYFNNFQNQIKLYKKEVKDEKIEKEKQKNSKYMK